MSSPSLICVGKIKDAHGIKGELYAFLWSGKADWLSNFTHLYLNSLQKERLSISDCEGLEVERARPHKKGLIVLTKSIADRTKAEENKGKFVYIPESWLVSKRGDNYFLHEIMGFEVINGEQSIGKIEAFSSNGAQDLIIVNTNSGKKEIPLVEAFIIRLDFDKKCLMMHLPEGLLDL